MISIVFFQAEDGIRDKLVTGVQTCALPISRSLPKGGKEKTTLRSAVGQGALNNLREHHPSHPTQLLPTVPFYCFPSPEPRIPSPHHGTLTTNTSALPDPFMSDVNIA